MKYTFVNDTLNATTQTKEDVRVLMNLMSEREKTDVAVQVLESFGGTDTPTNGERPGFYRVWVPAHIRTFKDGHTAKIPGIHKWMPNHLKFTKRSGPKKTALAASPTWKTRRERYPETSGFSPKGLQSLIEAQKARNNNIKSTPPVHITAEGPVQPRQGSLLE